MLLIFKTHIKYRLVCMLKNVDELLTFLTTATWASKFRLQLYNIICIISYLRGNIHYMDKSIGMPDWRRRRTRTLSAALDRVDDGSGLRRAAGFLARPEVYQPGNSSAAELDS